jgi:hypothetical protein
MRNAGLIASFLLVIILFSGCAGVMPGEEKFKLNFFEKRDRQGEPLSGTVYCGKELLGTLENGSVTMNKTLLLEKVGKECNLSVFGKYNGTPFDFCGWDLNETDIADYSSISYHLSDNSMYIEFRDGPCSTKESFVTPKDPVVVKALDEYLPLPNRTQDTYADLDAISDKLDKVFNYTKDEELPGCKDISNCSDWWLFPSELIKGTRGDCEDWSDAFLSLALARGPAPCYGITLDYLLANGSTGEGGHVTVFCAVNGVPRIYDQGSVYTRAIMWEELFDSLKENIDDNRTVRVKVMEYYNNTFYSAVDGKEDLYRKLGVKEPKKTELDNAMLAAFSDPNKMVLYSTVEKDGEPISITAEFVSDTGTKEYSVSGPLIINKNDLCEAGKEKYKEINATFDDSPVGETWAWPNVTYCNRSKYNLWITKDQFEEIKNPRFVLYFFERGEHQGAAMPGKVYCGNQLLGELNKGALNLSKTSLLEKVGEGCKIDIVGGYEGTPFEICGWNLDKSEVLRYSYYDFVLHEGGHISEYTYNNCHN